MHQSPPSPLALGSSLTSLVVVFLMVACSTVKNTPARGVAGRRAAPRFLGWRSGTCSWMGGSVSGLTEPARGGPCSTVWREREQVARPCPRPPTRPFPVVRDRADHANEGGDNATDR